MDLFRISLVLVVCLAQQRPALPAPAKTIEISNPSLENRGKGWMLSKQGKWLSEGAHQGETCALINSDVDAKIARCVLLTPALPQLQPGMKVRVAYYARWRAGNNQVFVTFHEDEPYWLSEIPLWKDSIPPDGRWHRMQAEVRVPQFLHRETALKLCIGLPYSSKRLGKDPKNTEYLLDDVSMEVLEAGKPVEPKRPVVGSFDKSDPRDEPSPYGVFWTPWKAFCRTTLSGPRDRDKTADEIRHELDLMQRIGVKWIRTIWRWDKLEWNKGEFDFALLDFVVAEAWKRDIRFVPALTTPPRWASRAPAGEPEFTIFPPRPKDWENFVFRTVDHFKGHVKYWEIWNEPNILDRWNGSVEDYFKLQKAAFTSARRADPRCKLLMGAFSGAPAYYLDALLRLGAKDYFDILSCHPYPRKYGLRKVDYLIRRLRVVLADYGCEDRPIWLTEIGCKAENAGGPAGRAKFLTDLYASRFGGAVEKHFWFTFDTWVRRTDGIGHGLVNMFEGEVQLSPAYYAYGKVAGKTLTTEDHQ